MKLDTAKAMSEPVVLLHSAEGALVTQALQTLLAAHAEREESSDHDIFVGDASSPAEWAGAAGVVPFLTETRIVVVRSLGRCAPAKFWDAKITKTHPFVKNLSSLPDTARLILVGDEEGGSQEKKQAAADQIEKWIKLVGFAGGMTVKLDYTPEEATKAIMDRAQQREKKLARPLADKLSQMLGGQIGLALAEVDKLALYMGDAKEITEEAIDLAVIPELDYNIFQLCDGVFKGDTRFALKQLGLLKSRLPDMQSEALSRVLPMLHRHLRFAWQARLCVEAKCRASDPPEKVKALFPDRPQLSSEKDWIQKKHMDSAKNLTFEKLGLCLSELAKADHKLKGITPSFKAEETVEVLVLSMAQICRDRSRTRI